MTHKIVVLKGDGIGPEIMDSALAILKQASQNNFTYKVQEMPFGGSAIEQVGHPFPKETQEACLKADAILLGAIGGPEWGNNQVTPEMGLLALRKSLNLFANLRPIKVNAELSFLSPLKSSIVEGTDFVIVRELIGGLYFGKPKYFNDEEAFDTMYYDRPTIERIVRHAFNLAMTRRKKVTSVDKANVLANSKLWRRIVTEISQAYPEVEVEHLYVDAASMKIITAPQSFDVMVMGNLFGDILSDEASVLVGSLGLLASSSINEKGLALYEPIHGSAPDIAGLDSANPMAMILSMTMMLRQSFGENALADRIDLACQTVMSEGILTADLNGSASLSEFTQAIVEALG